MDSDSDLLLNELIESQVDELIQDDEYYQGFATQLKSAESVKQGHIKQLAEFFKFQEYHTRLEHAQRLITDLMPAYVSVDAFAKIKQELENSGTHLSQFIESEQKSSERPILLQEMFGLSDETLIHIYAFGRGLVEKNNMEDACALFVLLSTLAPHVPSYWISEGICMQELGLHEQAIIAFSSAKFLSPSDPAPIAYSIETYRSLKDNDQIKKEMELLESTIETLDSDDKVIWLQWVNNFKIA